MLMARYLIFAGKANRDWNIIQMRPLNDGDEERPKPKERLLHAALRDPASSEEIVQLATIMDRSQLYEKDEQGNTPLHLACFRESGCTEYTVYPEVGLGINTGTMMNCITLTETCSHPNKNALQVLDHFASDDDTVYKNVNEEIDICEDPIPLESSEGSGRRTLLDRGYDQSATFIPILHSILKMNISAAKERNRDGSFPFSVLVDRGASWAGGGIDQVLKAHPAAIFSYKNLSNGIVVMAMGRVSRVSERYIGDLKQEEAACLGCMFELLKGKPTVLEGANIDLLSNSSVFQARRSKRLRVH